MKPSLKPIVITAVLVYAVFGLLVLTDPVYAWDCKAYNFRIRASGEVQVENRSSSDEPAQKADIFVNGEKVINNAQVPAMEAGSGWVTFASIDPPSGDWTWKVRGESDCSDSGEHHQPTPKPPTSTPVPSPTNTQTAVPPTATSLPTETAQPTATDVPPTDVPPTRRPPTDTPRPQPSDTPVVHKATPTATFLLPTATGTATPLIEGTEVGGCEPCGCCCVCAVPSQEAPFYELDLDEDTLEALYFLVGQLNEQQQIAVEQHHADMQDLREILAFGFLFVGLMNAIVRVYASRRSR